mgnify:CR=1
MELLLLRIFSAVLLACIFTGVSVIYAMLLGLVVFFGYGLIKKIPEICLPADSGIL